MVKISVIVPVYNCEDYLDESIKSILNQSFKDIEVICVDDGSVDDSLKILKKFSMHDARLKVLPQENQGVSVARNNALKKVSGDYIYFFDADDYLVADALEKAYNNAINNNSDIVIFNYDQYKEDSFLNHLEQDIGKQFPKTNFANFTFNCYDYRIRAFKGPFAPWFKLYKKEFLDRYEYFEFPPNLNQNDVRIDNPNSISNTRLKRFKDIFSIIQIVEDFLKDENLFEEFKEEFEYFKINRIIYEMKGRPNEYFLIAKDELSKVNHDNDLLSENVLFKFETIMNSNSIEEYNYKLEINNLKKKNEKFSKEIKKLKNQNRELKNKNNKLKKQNNEILNSKSWKLSEPFRKAKRILKK